MIAFHEGEVSYVKNPRRGAQFYPNCVQIEVVGDGTVELPEGVSFPGAYSYDDPGVVYDVRQSPMPLPKYLFAPRNLCIKSPKQALSVTCPLIVP